MNIILSIIMGALAGFLAGKIVKGSGNGFLLNLIVGILGRKGDLDLKSLESYGKINQVTTDEIFGY